MEENKNTATQAQTTEEQSAFSFQQIYTTVVLNWMWFALSLIICLGAAFAYLRYTTPVYQTSAKVLIKGDDSGYRRSSSVLNSMQNLGMMSNSAGLENEMEILKSTYIAKEAVTNLKLYTSYYTQGRVKEVLVYRNEPISVDINPTLIENLPAPIELEIKREGKKYLVSGTYFASDDDGKGGSVTKQFEINETITTFPAQISTKYDLITFTQNKGKVMGDGETYRVVISSPNRVATRYAAILNVGTTSRGTSIALLSIRDVSPLRASNYLEALVNAYNRQANDDKNEVALRTEDFINGRLEKISDELGITESNIESFKRSNRVVELDLSASEAMRNSSEFDQKLTEINTQVSLINNISTYLNNDANKYQVIPSNIGLTDGSTTQLISNYNRVALERNTLLRTASELNPTVKTLTSQLDDLYSSIRQAMTQAKNTLEIQRSSISAQYNKYQGQVLSSPQQQRVMNEIGRQQTVQTALYTLLLQKREENSISLAATADKGKLIDAPAFNGQVSPQNNLIYLIALALGLGFPALVLFLINFFKYKIESHDDVAKLTSLPIIADVAVANEAAKTRGEIVVHENKNNTMEEIFRSLRTNLQFMLQEGENVIMSTSSIGGEGKTFITSNLAISFALLGKKVVLIGLDIRKPRLAELFQLEHNNKGITPLLAMANPTEKDVEAQIVNSEVNKNLDILFAGPIPPNPAELVERKQLDAVIDILKKKYDYVLIDTAPVGLVTDTLQIARVANVTMAVVRADYTPKENIYMINDIANEGKMPNVAFVINGIDMSKKKYRYQYGYGRYGKYGKYGRRYGSYGKYGSYGTYGNYGNYGNYSNSHYSNKDDNSVKL